MEGARPYKGVRPYKCIRVRRSRRLLPCLLFSSLDVVKVAQQINDGVSSPGRRRCRVSENSIAPSLVASSRDQDVDRAHVGMNRNTGDPVSKRNRTGQVLSRIYPENTPPRNWFGARFALKPFPISARAASPLLPRLFYRCAREWKRKILVIVSEGR